MLPQMLKLRTKTRYYIVGLLLWGITIPTSAADTTYDVKISLQDFVTNLAKAVPNLTRMVTAIAYVLGMYFIVTGIMKFKQFGEGRTMMSQEHSVKGPMIYVVVGALLLYIPTAVQMGLSTFFTEPNPYSYLSNGDQWGSFLNAIYIIIQLVGVIAFIRGLTFMSHLGGGHGQPGTFAKGLSHIIGGIFCINIYQFVQIILITLGIQVQT